MICLDLVDVSTSPKNQLLLTVLEDPSYKLKGYDREICRLTISKSVFSISESLAEVGELSLRPLPVMFGARFVHFPFSIFQCSVLSKEALQANVFVIGSKSTERSQWHMLALFGIFW